MCSHSFAPHLQICFPCNPPLCCHPTNCDSLHKPLPEVVDAQSPPSPALLRQISSSSSLGVAALLHPIDRPCQTPHYDQL